MRGYYLQILQRYRVRQRGLRPRLDKEKLITNKVGRASRGEADSYFLVWIFVVDIAARYFVLPAADACNAGRGEGGGGAEGRGGARSRERENVRGGRKVKI